MTVALNLVDERRDRGRPGRRDTTSRRSLSPPPSPSLSPSTSHQQTARPQRSVERESKRPSTHIQSSSAFSQQRHKSTRNKSRIRPSHLSNPPEGRDAGDDNKADYRSRSDYDKKHVSTAITSGNISHHRGRSRERSTSTTKRRRSRSASTSPSFPRKRSRTDRDRSRPPNLDSSNPASDRDHAQGSYRRRRSISTRRYSNTPARGRDKVRDKNRDSDWDRDRDRQRVRDRERDRDRDKHRSRNEDKDRDRNKNRNRNSDRDYDQDRDRDRGRNSVKDRNRNSDKSCFYGNPHPSQAISASRHPTRSAQGSGSRHRSKDDRRRKRSRSSSTEYTHRSTHCRPTSTTPSIGPRTSSSVGSRAITSKKEVPLPSRSQSPPVASSQPTAAAAQAKRSSGPTGSPIPLDRADLEEPNMTRGGYRGSYRSHYNNPVSNSPYHPKQYANDSRNYYHSPGQHMSPSTSYHDSPIPHSPYVTGRSGWSGSQPSYPSPHPPPYSSQYGGYLNVPQGHFSPNPPHSPFSAPAGPMQQYSQAPPYRGSYRGGSNGGFRGHPFGHSRGSHRGSHVQNSPWPSGGSRPPSGSRIPRSQGDDARASVTDNHTNPDGNAIRHKDQVRSGPLAPDHEGVGDNHISNKENDEAKTMEPPPMRPPPAGSDTQPEGPKFSFAFNKSAKPAAATPKPEISQKFNVAPNKRSPNTTVTDGRSRDSSSRGPTAESSSGLARYEPRSPQVEVPKPVVPPRTRTIKKTMRRLKPRPTLEPELAASDSVFYRKPGDESVVGSGTYGKVFKGVNVYTKALVALKRIRMEGEKDGFPVTAVREIKLLQSLRHQNIVCLQEVMVEKNDCFMVFEYLSHDLTGILNHPTFRLGEAQKKNMSMQIMDGLDYLHKRGVLHRDIKAANILVSSDGVLKLADFGLARFYAKRHRLDYTNRVITIWYRSPELLLGETSYTASVDVWSAACVMMEIFTGRAIFPGDGTEVNQLDLTFNILGTPSLTDWPGLRDMPWYQLLRPSYRRPSVFADRYRDKLPPAAFDLLSSMFGYDPTQRPTAAEVLAHPYFVSEDPPPRQAVELRDLQGDWHELESKALRKKGARERERKRALEPNESGQSSQRNTKRPHVEEVAEPT